MFAKLFESEKYGQILVKIDSDLDGNPEVRIWCEPDGFGACSLAATAKDDSDESWDSMYEVFNNADIVSAEATAKIIFEACGIFK